MSDIVHRLRTEMPNYGALSTTQILREEAATEINRLRDDLGAALVRENNLIAEGERLRASLQRLLDWNEGIAAGRGNHYPREHADIARAALAHQQSGSDSK